MEDAVGVELRALRWAIIAAQHKSLGRAAETLNIRRSTLSRGLRDLEHRLGAILFERTNGGTRPTLAGVRSPQYAPRRCKVIRSVGGPVVAYDIGIPEADYIVHSANAHPKLVELLALVADPAFLELEAAQRFLVSARARALLAELESFRENENDRPHRYPIGGPR